MSERENAHSIPRKTLETHLKKVDEHLESIPRGPTERVNLLTLVKGIGGVHKEMVAPEVQNSIEALRYGSSLYYAMHDIITDRMKTVDASIQDKDKRAFANTYAMFAGSAYVQHQLDLALGSESPIEFKKEGITFDFNFTKDETLRLMLAKYYGLLNSSKRANLIEKGIDVARVSHDFFKFVVEQAIEKKTAFNSKLVDLIKDTQFRVADEFTIEGFQAIAAEEKSKAKVEFVPTYPHQVAGNVLAKKEMLRDMDRIALFDPIAKKNPIMEVGGLSWSVLYDGFPGTGKSTLFKMGLTRLNERSEQVSIFWKTKNIESLKPNQLIVDQGVKDEYYGKTGKNLLAMLEQAKKTDAYYIITTDDIDLLVSGDRNSSSGGSDKDILNILMQFSDGINTVIRGNTQWWAATNDATAMDPALRQRFIARYMVDGPQEWYDFADILNDKLNRWVSTGIVDVPAGKDYTPYEMRKGQTGNEQTKTDSVAGKFRGMFTGKVSMRDIGEVCKNIRDDNPRFTGRAIHAVAEAMKKRINDYEIPNEWFEKPDLFFAQDYKRRVDMLKELCRKVDGNIIIDEIERYALSEKRYADDRFESDVKKKIHEMRVYEQAIEKKGDKK